MNSELYNRSKGEEAFRRLVEMYKMRDETAIGIWEKINNEYDDTVDYRLMFRRRE